MEPTKVLRGTSKKTRGDPPPPRVGTPRPHAWGTPLPHVWGRPSPTRAFFFFFFEYPTHTQVRHGTFFLSPHTPPRATWDFFPNVLQIWPQRVGEGGPHAWGMGGVPRFLGVPLKTFAGSTGPNPLFWGGPQIFVGSKGPNPPFSRRRPPSPARGDPPPLRVVDPLPCAWGDPPALRVVDPLPYEEELDCLRVMGVYLRAFCSSAPLWPGFGTILSHFGRIITRY